MGKFDNYSNLKSIAKAQKKLDKLSQKRKPDHFKIELAQRELDTERLFESCQRLVLSTYDYAKMHFLFSDENKVTLFGGILIPYEDIDSYRVVANNVTVGHTTTRSKDAFSRAIVGGAIAGDIGAVVGALSAEEESNTTYKQVTEGFFFQLLLKNGKSYQCHFRGAGLFSNKLPKGWMQLGERVKMIIEEQGQ